MQSNFIEITLWHERSLVNFLHIFRTPVLKNTSGGLLLILRWQANGRGNYSVFLIKFQLSKVFQYKIYFTEVYSLFITK